MLRFVLSRIMVQDWRALSFLAGIRPKTQLEEKNADALVSSVNTILLSLNFFTIITPIYSFSLFLPVSDDSTDPSLKGKQRTRRQGFFMPRVCLKIDARAC